MKLTLIRHTSVDVPKGTCYGITDVPLAPAFRNEMEQVRIKLGTGKFDAVFSSPMKRCIKLASGIFPEAGIRIDKRLTELDFGDWEMTSWNDIFESPEGKNWFADYLNTRCPNGESFSELVRRVQSFLEDLKQAAFDQIVVITHAGIIRAFMCLLQDKTAEEAFHTPLECGQIITINFDYE